MRLIIVAKYNAILEVYLQISTASLSPEPLDIILSLITDQSLRSMLLSPRGDELPSRWFCWMTCRILILGRKCMEIWRSWTLLKNIKHQNKSKSYAVLEDHLQPWHSCIITQFCPVCWDRCRGAGVSLCMPQSKHLHWLKSDTKYFHTKKIFRHNAAKDC